MVVQSKRPGAPGGGAAVQQPQPPPAPIFAPPAEVVKQGGDYLWYFLAIGFLLICVVGVILYFALSR
jgi:hypothetical protein